MKKFENHNFLEAQLLTSQLFENKAMLTGLFYVHDSGLEWKKGSYVYLQKGLLHNLYGPAYITSHSLTYAFNGDIHRDNAPAFENFDQSVIWSGDKFVPAEKSKVLDFKYFYKGLLHRLNGVAVKNQYGKPQYNHYSILGQKYSSKDYRNHPLVKGRAS